MPLIIARTAVSLLLIVTLGACGQASVDDARRAGQAARDAAAEANARVADLEATVAHLQDVALRLRSSTRGLASDLKQTERAELRRHRGVMDLSKRLRKSIGQLKDSVRAADDHAAAASQRARRAAASASELARDLAVLTKRFDYHLKHSGR